MMCMNSYLARIVQKMAVVGLLLVSPQILTAAEVTVFGPETCTCDSWMMKTIIRTFSVSNPDVKYVMRIYEEDGNNRWDSQGYISLNGETTVTPFHFLQRTSLIEIPVSLKASNRLEIRLTGMRGSAFTLCIIGVGNGGGGNDEDAPTIQIVMPANGSVQTVAKPRIKIAYSDDLSGIDQSSFAVKVNGVDCQHLFTITATQATYQPGTDLPEGDNTVTATITDKAGNSASATSTFRIDCTDNDAPTIRVVKPANGCELTEKRPPIEITYSDALSGIDPGSFSATINGQDSTHLFNVAATRATCQPSVDLPEGENTVTAGIKDKAGNQSQCESKFTILTSSPPPPPPPPPGTSGKFNVFGPEGFTGQSWQTKTYKRDFTVFNPDAVYSIRVYEEGDKFCWSFYHISISLNGKRIITSLDLSFDVLSFERSVSLQQNNQLTVVVSGKPSETLFVHIEGIDQDLPDIQIVEPADGASVNESQPLIRVTYSDAISGIDLSSFSARINDVNCGELFTVTETEATYQPATNLPGGENRIEAAIQDNAGNQAATTSTFSIGGVIAVPGANPTTGTAPLTVHFSPYGEDPDGTIEIYRWDFDGDGQWDTYDTVASDYSHTYHKSGTYKPTLYVKSSTGIEATAEVTIEVLNSPPQVTADVVPSNGEVPLAVQMTASATDPDGNIVLYEWDFEGDGTYDWSSTDSGTSSHTYSAVGLHQAVCRATDNEGLSATAMAITTVIAVGPVGSPTATASANPTVGDAPLNVSFTGTGTDPDNSIVLYEWDFNGDGTYDWSSPTTGNTTHTYTVAGTHVAAFRVTDQDGLTGVDHVVLTVTLNTGLSVSPNTVGYLGTGPDVTGTTITTSISADTEVSLYIKDTLGNIIRTLVPQQARTAGSYADIWDCNDHSGFVVNDGLYYAVLAYKLEEAWHELDLTYTTGGTRHSFPMGTGCDRRAYFQSGYTITPLDDDFMPLTFTLCKAQEVTAFMGILWSSNTRVRTIVNRQAFPAGVSTIHWDGLDDQGNISEPPPGDKIITGFWRYDLPDNAICVTGGTPEITDVDAIENYFSAFSEKCDQQGNDEGVTLAFKLSEPCVHVELRVYSVVNSDLVRSRLINNLNAGEHTVFWDGKNNDGEYVDIGDYRIGIIAKDVDGNESMLRYSLVRIDY